LAEALVKVLQGGADVVYVSAMARKAPGRALWPKPGGAPQISVNTPVYQLNPVMAAETTPAANWPGLASAAGI